MGNPANLVLVGGLGFVGRNILDALADSAFAPAIIDDLSNADVATGPDGVPTHLGRYQDREAIRFVEGLDGPARIFVFLAGETRVAESSERPLDFIDANITDPSAFVLQAVRPGDHFILISTAGALFDGTHEVRTTSPYCPKNFYGATKAAEEMVLEKLVALRGGTFSVVRLTNVYGPHSGKKKSAIHAFIRAALHGQEVTINGDGQQSRDFVFAGDVGRAVVTQAGRVAAGEPFEAVNMVGSGTSTTLLDVVAEVERAVGAPLKRQHTPAKQLLATEPRDVIANGRDVQALLGDGITPFSQGIDATVAYYRSHL